MDTSFAAADDDGDDDLVIRFSRSDATAAAIGRTGT